MKILHIVPTYLPSYRYGGPIKSVHELNKWLVKQGVEVTVYTTNIDGNGVLNVPLGEEVLIDGVRIYYFPITFKPWQYSRAMHLVLKESLKNFDLIHITSVFLAASILGAYYAKKFKKPYVISPRGNLMLDPLKKNQWKKKIYNFFIERKNLKDAVVHFTTEMEKKEFFNNNFSCKDSFVLPNGIDDININKELKGFFRKEYGIKNDEELILFLSRLSWKKGLDTLIPAMAMVLQKYPKTTLVLAGGDDENYRKTIENLIRKYDIGNKVIFTGMVVGDDKTAVFLDSDIFVLPSYSENFGNVVLESLQFGLPIIITKGVAIYPDIEKFEAGIVIDKDEKQLANAILKLISNPKLCSKMGANGSRMIGEKFAWPEISKKLIKIYNSILDKENY